MIESFDFFYFKRTLKPDGLDPTGPPELQGRNRYFNGTLVISVFLKLNF